MNQPGGAGSVFGAKSSAGPPAFWSGASVEGRPLVLVLDASGNRDGWESEWCERVASSLVRHGVTVVGGGPLLIHDPPDFALRLHPSDRYNCVFVCAHPDGPLSAARCWAALKLELAGTRKLLAVCTWDGHDEELTGEVLAATDTFAALAVSQRSPLSVRAAGLFFMKFFAELDLHSHASNSMTGKMVWFGHSKAREILRRRKYSGIVGLRA